MRIAVSTNESTYSDNLGFLFLRAWISLIFPGILYGAILRVLFTGGEYAIKYTIRFI